MVRSRVPGRTEFGTDLEALVTSRKLFSFSKPHFFFHFKMVITGVPYNSTTHCLDFMS